MTDWFVRVELDEPVTDDQAEAFAQRIGSTFVDRARGRTEVSAYVTAASARQAVSEGLEQVNAAAMVAGFEGRVTQVEAKTESDRIAELVSQGIPEVVGVAEIQEILQINTRQQVSQLAEREDFPRPVAELRAGRIWLRSDIDDFGKRWRRKPGRSAATRYRETGSGEKAR
jgi:hypothetical protein